MSQIQPELKIQQEDVELSHLQTSTVTALAIFVLSVFMLFLRDEYNPVVKR